MLAMVTHATAEPPLSPHSNKNDRSHNGTAAVSRVPATQRESEMNMIFKGMDCVSSTAGEGLWRLHGATS